MRRHPKILARLLPDGYVLLHALDSNQVHTLTPLGGLVWEYCDGQSADDITRQLMEIDELSKLADLREQISVLTCELKEAGLLLDEDSPVLSAQTEESS
jgi:Coenzyme PQQ synthesis protein D (PqqD)